MKIEDYLIEHGTAQEPPTKEEHRAADARQQVEKETARAAELKANIADALGQGIEPQYILYTAIEALGAATHDSKWAADCRAALDTIYGDLQQRALFMANEATAAARLEAQEEKYNKTLRGSLKRQLAGYNRIAEALRDALTSLDGLDKEAGRLPDTGAQSEGGDLLPDADNSKGAADAIPF